AASVQAGVATAAAKAVPAGPPKKKVLVVGDENLLFTAGLQKAYEDVEFSVATCLSWQNLEAYSYDPHPAVLGNRVQHMVDPCRVGWNFHRGYFDGLMLFLPGLSFMIPRELGSADRALFAFRTHHFLLNVLGKAKACLRAEDGLLHLVWPDEIGLMSSPCGAAGLEIPQLLASCGCRPAEAAFDIGRLEAGAFQPFLFGDVPPEVPEWLSGAQIHSYTCGSSAISIPMS
ncbi:unnamed protein product, partial [Prorocentrum cordatum]